MNRRAFPVVALLLLMASSSNAQGVTAVANLDLNRYSGKWFEIARFPNKFQKNCISNVVATYVERKDGDIDVINHCETAAGTTEEAVGRVRLPDPAVTAKLKVRFAPQWLSWLPIVWADYWVLDLTADYSVVAVGEPTKKYLWILARNPAIAEPAYQALMKRLVAQGYEPNRLVLTRQDAWK